MPKIIDLAGKTFGRLTVINFIESRGGHSYWVCMCECGNTTTTNTDRLRSGKTKSCGCLGKEIRKKANTKHGKTKTITYSSYKRMKTRCTNPNYKYFYHYGGRGITICNEWLNNPEQFIIDMGERPSTKHTLERIDNSKGYSPNNCRWATRKEQQNNRRNCHFITHNGETKTISQWAESLNLSETCIRTRISRGWSEENALSKPIRKVNHKIR